MNLNENPVSSLNIADLESSLKTAPIGHRILYLPSVSSTMDIARHEAANGAKEGVVVVAENQTSGRGRLGKKWVTISQENLSFSVLLYPETWACSKLSIVVGAALINSIRKITNLSPTLKWPNDVRLNGKKVCGILIETDLEDPTMNRAVIGIGINVNANPGESPEAEFSATSLAKELGKPLSRSAVLKAILLELGLLYKNLNSWQSIWQTWHSSLDTIGTHVKIRFGDHVEEGLAEDVDEQGNLLLRRYDGVLTTISAGEVTFQL